MTLDPRQTRAAELIGAQGRAQKEAAEECGVDVRTVRRWAERPEFQDLVRERREAKLESSPSARAVLESALNSTSRDGSPDWATRLRAAELLIRGGDTTSGYSPAVRETKIYVAAEE
ncbi:MAG: hypothetical protein AABM29_02840 [Actinomycetota bacterium]